MCLPDDGFAVCLVGDAAGDALGVVFLEPVPVGLGQLDVHYSITSCARTLCWDRVPFYLHHLHQFMFLFFV